MFYLEDKTEDLSLGHSISDNSEKLFQGNKVGAGHIGLFATKDQTVGTSKYYC